MDFDAQLKAFAQRVLTHDSNEEATTQTSEIPSNIPEKEVVLYQTDDGNINISVFYYDETFWLTQKAMGELFDTSKQSISYHLNLCFI